MITAWRKQMKQWILCLGLILIIPVSQADTADSILGKYKNEASQVSGFQGFSAAHGEAFFKTKHGHDWSCSTCHTEDPTNPGKHEKTGKVIKPMAPSVNPERFSDLAKVEKWFKRNCNDVLDRACTAQEKGDVMSYLMSLKK